MDASVTIVSKESFVICISNTENFGNYYTFTLAI